MRINGKITEIERYLSELEDILPGNFEEYEKDFTKKAACERYFERIVEAIIDVAFLMIKKNKYKIPEEDKAAFDVLSEENIISIELAEKLKDAKGMRNIIAHEYGRIDDSIVFESITKELIKDTDEFLKAIKNKRILFLFSSYNQYDADYAD